MRNSLSAGRFTAEKAVNLLFEKLLSLLGFIDNADIIYENLRDELIKLGVKPICTRTGNSYTRKISYDNKYPLGVCVRKDIHDLFQK